MEKGLWSRIAKPMYILAPMANVTDAAFRRIIAKYGKPDVMWTEFVSADGLCSPGREALIMDFWYTENERPIVAQIFGSQPEHFYKSACLVRELGFDGIDINMGCPERNVLKQGAGAAHIKDPEHAKEIIRETKRGAGGLPVSVKTRIGFNTDTLEEWLGHLLEMDLAAITIHARTKKEMSLVPANWDAIHRAVEYVRAHTSGEERPYIIGNGDIVSMKDAAERVSASSADGAMIGRGIFGNPWFFSPDGDASTKTLEERMRVMLEHTDLFWELFQEKKNFDIMKKHYKAYVSGFDGAKELRMRLMETKTRDEVHAVVRSVFSQI